MLKVVGLSLLALLLFACFCPVYGMLVIFPVTFAFGHSESLYIAELVVVYVLSAATAVWLVVKLGRRKKPAASSESKG